MHLHGPHFHIPLRLMVRLLGVAMLAGAVLLWFGYSRWLKRREETLAQAERDALLGRRGDLG